jgi:SRSO17 transposase
MEGQDMDAQQIRGLKPKLIKFLARFDDCFPRCDTRQHLPVYVEGQLSDLQRKSVEPIALRANVPVRTLQEFLSQHCWDEDRMRQRLQEIVATEHGGPRTIGIIDETSDAKKGVKTPGVQRQYCGAEGKQDNCIVTVHLGLAVDDFHCLVDGELFLPEGWSKDRERCREAGIPDTMVYRPKTAIALELYDRARANGVTFAYLTFDEWYGSKPEFLREVDRREQRYVAEVHKHFVAWLAPAPRVTHRPYRRSGRGRGRRGPRLTAGSPKAHFLKDLMGHPTLRDQAWQCMRVKDGEKGPMVWEVKHALIHPKDENGLPGKVHHLIVARNVLNPKEIKYFVSNAPPDTPVEELLVVAFARWRVERCFEDQKGELGLDHYEGRRYRGLKRHLILTGVSYLFLSRVHQDLRGEKPGVNGVPGAHGDGGGGMQLVAIGTSLHAPVRTSFGRDPVCPETPGPSAQEPHENDPTQVASPWHTPNQPPTVPMEYDLAL